VRSVARLDPTTRAKKDDFGDGTVAQGVRGGTIPRSKQWKSTVAKHLMATMYAAKEHLIVNS
jgi:hypothetical protein